MVRTLSFNGPQELGVVDDERTVEGEREGGKKEKRGGESSVMDHITSM